MASLGRYCGFGKEFIWASDLPLLTLRGVVALLKGSGKALKGFNISKNPGIYSMYCRCNTKVLQRTEAREPDY